MAGIMEALFGPDGPGGKPGAVGKAYNAVADTPVASLLTIPTEIFNDPLKFTNGEGKFDLAALLSPNAQKTFAAQRKANEDATKMRAVADMVNTGDKVLSMFSQQPTPEAQDAVRRGLTGMGVSADTTDPFNFAAQNSRDVARRAGAAAGLLPEVANIANVNTAQQAGQAQLGNRFNIEEQTHGGEVTRQNQASQFGFSSKLAGQRHSNRMTEIGYGGQVQGDVATHKAELDNWLADNGYNRDVSKSQYNATVDDWKDSRKQGRKFKNTIEEKRYQATLDNWKQVQSAGAPVDPYPVLEAINKSGKLAGTPAEMYAQAHLANRTDAKGAASLLNTLAETSAKPPAGAKGSATAAKDSAAIATLTQLRQGGQIPSELIPYADAAITNNDGELARKVMTPPAAAGATYKDRASLKQVKDLRIRLKKGMVPEGLVNEVQSALRSKNGASAGQLISRMNDMAVASQKGGSAMEALRAHVTGPNFAHQTPAMQQLATEIVDNNDAAAATVLMPKIIAHDEAGVRATLADPRFKALKTEGAALQDTKRGLGLSMEAASIPGRPGQIRKDLFGPWLNLLPDQMIGQYGYLTQDKGWQEAKAALQSAGNMSLASYILSKSGKQASDREREALRTSWPFGNEVSDTVFLAKMRAVEKATAAEEAAKIQEAKLLADSALDPSGQIAASFGVTEAQRIRTQLIAELKQADASQADQMPDRPLTPEERAELNGGR